MYGYNQVELRDEEKFPRFTYAGRPDLFELWMLPTPVGGLSFLLSRQLTYTLVAGT